MKIKIVEIQVMDFMVLVDYFESGVGHQNFWNSDTLRCLIIFEECSNYAR